MEVVSDAASYMNAGIHENVVLTKVEYNISKNGNEFLAFYFNDEYGDSLSHTEYAPKPRVPFEELDSKDKEAFYNRVNNQRKRIGQIVTSFISKDLYDFTSNSFKEFAETIVKLLQSSINNTKVRIKVVYNNKNFTTLPSYWKHRFIENMNIPKEESRIKLLDIDTLTKTKPNIISKVNEVLDTEDDLDPLSVPEMKDEIPF